MKPTMHFEFQFLPLGKPQSGNLDFSNDTSPAELDTVLTN